MTTQLTSDRIPPELAHLPSEARLLALDLANRLLSEGTDLPVALNIAQARAEAWVEGTEEEPIYHLIPHTDGWQLVRAGSDAPGDVTGTKQQALDAARTRARKESARLIIHGQDGAVQSIHDYKE